MEGKQPNTTHRWSVIFTESKGRKTNPTFTEITSALDGPRPRAPRGTHSMSCADTECVAGLKCSPGTVTPTLPTASFVPMPREGGSSLLPRKHPRRDKADAQIPQILAQVSSTSSKSLCGDCAAPFFSCSLIPSQSLSLLLSSTSCVVWQHWDLRGCCWH